MPLVRKRAKSDPGELKQEPHAAALKLSSRKNSQARMVLRETQQEDEGVCSKQELSPEGISLSFKGAIRAFDAQRRRKEQFEQSGEVEEVSCTARSSDGSVEVGKGSTTLLSDDAFREEKTSQEGEVEETWEEEEEEDPYAWRKGENQVRVKFMTDQEIMARYGVGLPIYGTRRKFDLSPLEEFFNGDGQEKEEGREGKGEGEWEGSEERMEGEVGMEG
ncbi:hypothetical protein GUITHDRAFT_118711 [Guillardia theta CCMP2712]|uniref:Uncharacterized protein n=1 Tax=Guillardia theta (strain CCMP2712) TaxID=905079 RepID=L1IG41_GUITC|nr:hypothetical protein GUITHDRAFT_118711 [Guillardia theta CCMP2712]EKX35057.1 hypothetical protein GUITHDRAFT_118711 [Guillardia theta CCMP2712]|eukprot:XP_005822037.1 hypothetical protein GUITHDRAFT_118711 [Guillardia theta CCMP2712]